MSETRNLERIAIALERQVQLLEKQNILLDDILNELEDMGYFERRAALEDAGLDPDDYK